MYRKEAIYDKETRDWACYINGELIGFARTYPEAVVLLDQVEWELINTPRTIDW